MEKQQNFSASDRSAESKDEKTEIRVIGRGYLSLLLRVLLVALFVFLLFTKVFLIARVSGNEMFPAVKDGDLVLAFRLQRDYAKNDVVVYEWENEKKIGRVAALEGDVVTLDDSGALTVNGTLQSGEILFPTDGKEKLFYPYKVPAGSVFLLGDHRGEAQDSRDYGSVSLEKVEGKVITLLRRRGI